MPNRPAATVWLPWACSRARKVSRCSALMSERSSSGAVESGGGSMPPISWGRLAREISGESSITLACSRALRNWPGNITERGFSKMKTVDKLTKDELVSLARFDSIVRNNGLDPETERNVTMTDAMDLPSAAIMIPRVLTQFVQEGVEPLLIGSSLLQRIRSEPGMQTVFPDRKSTRLN